MKNSLICAFIALLLFCVQSCEKKDLTDTKFNTEVSSSLKSEISLVEVKLSSESCLRLLKSQEDLEIQKYLYQIGLAIIDLTLDPSFNNSVISAAKQNDFKLVEVDKLCQENLDFKNKLNHTLQSNSLKYNIGDALRISKTKIDEIAAGLIYKGNGSDEHYVPCILVLNADYLDPTLQPIISSGIAVNADMLPEFDDYIFAWIIQKDGTFKEVVLSEEQAMTLKNPLFIVDNGQQNARRLGETQALAKTLTLDSHKLKSTTYENYVYTGYFRINYRYEDSGDSDYTMLAWGFGPNSQSSEIMQNSNGNLTEWLEIATVAPANIGYTQSSMEYFSYDYGTWEYHFQTYERDWWRSQKYLGQCSRNGNYHYFYGSVQYESEWYSFTTTGLLPDIYLPGGGMPLTYTFDSSKGFQTLDRAL